jgi:hypothetical protein
VQQLARSQFLPVQVAGSINASTKQRVLWLHLKSFPKGPSAICTYLWFEVLRLKQSDHPAAKSRRLLIQVDNACSENKNRTVFAFAAWLVLLGYFDEVEIHFLLAGHTHDDIDSMFGEAEAAFKQQRECCHYVFVVF